MDLDITEQKKSERALKELNETLEQRVANRTAELAESEGRLRLFVEHAPAALAMFDRDMHYLSASRRWLTDYGLEGRNLLGLSHYEVFPEISEYWKEAHRRGLAGEVVQTEEDRFDRADGSVQWLRWEIRPWNTATGEIGGIVIFTEDITDRKKAEDEIKRYMEELRVSNEELTRFNRAAVDRELRMVELKKEINKLSTESGHPPPYKVDFGE